MSLQCFQWAINPQVSLMVAEGLSKEEAGRLIQQRRAKAGLTQDQLADQLSVDKSYISKLEGGIHGVRGSKYLPGLARILQLSEGDIKAINPSAVFNIDPPPHPFSAAAKGYKIPKQEPPPIPDALLEAARLFGDDPKYADLREYRWQRWMEQVPHKERPNTPLEWLDFYLTVKNKVNPPEPQE